MTTDKPGEKCKRLLKIIAGKERDLELNINSIKSIYSELGQTVVK